MLSKYGVQIGTCKNSVRVLPKDVGLRQGVGLVTSIECACGVVNAVKLNEDFWVYMSCTCAGGNWLDNEKVCDDCGYTFC